MKIHSVAWGWTPTPEDMPAGDSLKRIADGVKSLGFDGVDYLSTFESLDGYFTLPACRALGRVRALAGAFGGRLRVSVGRLNDPDGDVTEAQLDYFRKCAACAQALGAKIVSCIIPRSFGARPTRGNASPSEKRAYNLPAGYCWQADWEGLPRRCKRRATSRPSTA